MNRDDELFEELLELSAEEQTAFLERLGREDPACRDRLVALLTGYSAADNFLENSPVARPAPPPEEKPGDVIGAYTLLRKIGEGGCGVVYLADQSHPVRRQVALKIIKLGMDTLQVVARFEAERQALALMDHPDIARVFDAGATATGRPYFVMEYVDGVPITKFCDQRSLGMAERLELFARVCVAMQHAHQKGIIHRDVKPSNILVAERDGAAAPKIIDFGIAKATRDRLTEHTLLTAFDQFIGTPAYMSPEQAELREFDIDTRSDVYSLGVLLYELLTGRPPYDPKSLVQAGIEEIRRIIREVDPPRPSAAISTLTQADRTTVAQLRRAVPTHLQSVLRGDLDWIVMRCLEKDRERRYDTATALAEDVRRHLRREPVLARPPDLFYRAQKYVARNRLLCGSVVAVSLSLIVGTVVSVRQAVRATRAERVAVTERDVAQAATAAEALARTDAQRRQEQAEDLLTFMLGDFRTELEKIGRLELLDAVGEKAMAYFAALDPRDLTDTALTRQAKALTQIGEVRMNQARYEDATTAFATAHRRAAELSARHPDSGDALFERGQAEFWLGYVARRRGDLSTSRQWLTAYRDSTLGLAALEGGTARAERELTYGHHNLAVADFDAGDYAAARLGFNAEARSLEAQLLKTPDDRDLRYALAVVHSFLGSIAEHDGHYPEALEQFAALAAAYAELQGLDPDVVRWQWKYAQALVFAGGVRSISDDVAGARSAFAEAHTRLQALVTLDPTNQEWLAAELNLQLQQLMLPIPPAESSAAHLRLQSTRQQLEQLAATEATAQRFSRHLATAWRLEASDAMSADLSTAHDAIDRALEVDRRLVATQTSERWILTEFAQALILQGRIRTAQNQPAAAAQSFQQALATLPADYSVSRDWRLLDPAVQALTLLGESDEARPLAQRLREMGYFALDPFAASLIEAAASPLDSTSTP